MLQKYALAAGTALAVLIPTAAFAQAEAPQSGGLGEIVVTAEKKPSTEQRTPIAMTVATGKELATSGVVNIAQLQTIAPTVNFAQNNANTMITIRGVSSRNYTETGDPAVAVSLDNFYLQRAFVLNASLFAATILPLSTAHVICEGMGFEAGLDHKFREAPAFYWLYTILIVVGAGIVLLPNAPLWKIFIFSQVGNGIWLPIVVIFVLLLVNRKDLMGDYTNTFMFNLVAWITAIAMIILTFVLVAQSIYQVFHPPASA